MAMELKRKKKKEKGTNSLLKFPKYKMLEKNYSIMGFTVLQTANIVFIHKEWLL